MKAGRSGIYSRPPSASGREWEVAVCTVGMRNRPLKIRHVRVLVLCHPIREKYRMLQLSCLPWFYSTCTWGLLLCPLIIMLALFRTIKFQSLVHHVYPTCPKVNLNPSHYSESGTLLQVLPHRHHPSLAPASFMLSAIADSDKPFEAQQAVSRHRVPLIHPGYGVRCAHHLSFRNMYRGDLELIPDTLIPGIGILLFIMT
jgi:hypothetical protein